MKSLLIKTAAFRLLAAASLTISACSSSLEQPAPGAKAPDERVGNIGLKLQPVSGITVNNVHYSVTAGSPSATPAPAMVAEGNLPTPGTSADFSFGVPLPVGSGYYISISGASAEADDDITCTGSYGPFAVTPNSSTVFNLTLLCVDNTNGQVLSTVDVKTDACPRLIVDYAVAEPASVQPGQDIALHAAAHDLDNPAETITYAWSISDPMRASVGQFNPTYLHDTSFRCNQNSSDFLIEITATNHECSKLLGVQISCSDAHCGNGILDPGETCDRALDRTCPSDCTLVCGDGNVEGTEECDPLPFNPLLCNPPDAPNPCRLPPMECGDGLVSSGEACDGTLGPGNVALRPRTYCNSTCSAIVVADCGNGLLEPGEECEPSRVPPLGANCSSDCHIVFEPECYECEQAGDCFASSDNCFGPGGTFTSEQTAECWSVTECILDSGCLRGATGSIGKCYCGTLSTAACAAAPFDLTKPGAPNGPCAGVMQIGNPAAFTNSAILVGLTGKGRPTGAAGQRLNCQKTDPTCAPLCGVN